MAREWPLCCAVLKVCTVEECTVECTVTQFRYRSHLISLTSSCGSCTQTRNALCFNVMGETCHWNALCSNCKAPNNKAHLISLTSSWGSGFTMPAAHSITPAGRPPCWCACTSSPLLQGPALPVSSVTDPNKPTPPFGWVVVVMSLLQVGVRLGPRGVGGGAVAAEADGGGCEEGGVWPVSSMSSKSGCCRGVVRPAGVGAGVVPAGQPEYTHGGAALMHAIRVAQAVQETMLACHAFLRFQNVVCARWFCLDHMSAQNRCADKKEVGGLRLVLACTQLSGSLFVLLVRVMSTSCIHALFEVERFE